MNHKKKLSKKEKKDAAKAKARYQKIHNENKKAVKELISPKQLDKIAWGIFLASIIVIGVLIYNGNYVNSLCLGMCVFPILTVEAAAKRNKMSKLFGTLSLISILGIGVIILF